jgi:hypothetical protein
LGTIVLTGPTDLYSSWQVPPFEASPEERLNWVEEQIQEGEGYLSGQRSYKNLPKNLEIYEGIIKDKNKSTLCTNYLKFNIRKFVETISEVREIATYGSDAAQFKPFCEVLNKVAKAVYLESDFPDKLAGALLYASVMGCGYIWQRCIADEYGYGERKIEFVPLGPLDVVPIQIPRSNDVQDAYAVTIYEYMPIAEAHGRFPLFQSQLKPVAGLTVHSRLAARRLDFAERARYGVTPELNRNWGNLYCEIRYTFIRDLRINTTGYELPMGDENTSWYYKVPSVGSQILGGIQGGAPYYREAQPEDCRVYPQLRLITSAHGVDQPMYDGPGYDWHGKIPTVQYLVDSVPWEPGGDSLVQNVASIEVTKRKHERKMDQVLTTRLNPPMAYDASQTGGTKVENFDIFEENVRIGVEGQPNLMLQSALPDEVQVTDANFKFLDYLVSTETSQLGINDLTSLEDLKMNIAQESFDKVIETIGPIAKGIARGVESGNKKIGFMLKFMIPQWFNTARIIQYIGPDNLTQEVYDFDPTSMIPSHGIEEMIPDTIPGTIDPETGIAGPSRIVWKFPETPSIYDQNLRAKRFAKNVRLASVPNTLLEVTQMQEMLKYLQLWRGGAPISFSTVAKKLRIENYGEVKGNTEFEKWVNEQIEMLKVKIAASQLASALMPQPPMGGAGSGQPGIQEPKKEGRPPSGQAPPKLEQKGANTWTPRTTVSESG